MGGVRKNGHDLKLLRPDIHSSVCETSVVERQNATREKKKSSDEAERAFDRRETRWPVAPFSRIFAVSLSARSRSANELMRRRFSSTFLIGIEGHSLSRQFAASYSDRP